MCPVANLIPSYDAPTNEALDLFDSLFVLGFEVWIICIVPGVKDSDLDTVFVSGNFRK
jgi:hypothetical protein